MRVSLEHIYYVFFVFFSTLMVLSGVPEGQLVGGVDRRHDQQRGGGAGHDAF